LQRTTWTEVVLDVHHEQNVARLVECDLGHSGFLLGSAAGRARAALEKVLHPGVREG
jgi:hypothetical protein